MLEFCQDQASPAILSVTKEIKRSKASEEGLDLASLAIPPIGRDLANGDAFLLWDALGRESNCPSLISVLGLESDDNTRRSITKKIKALYEISKTFNRDIKSAKKKDSITSRLCALLSGQRPRRHKESSVADEVCALFIISNSVIHFINQMDLLCQDDIAPSPSGDSSASYTSSRPAMEQVMDAVVDVDVDVAIPQLSQPSQLSLVYLEANEAPALRPTGRLYAVVICCLVLYS
jgi:hypothetical protein